MADLQAMEAHWKTVIAQVTPAVVAVRVGTGMGSGVVISSNGLVACAAHVCGAPDREVWFTFPDGRKARGKTLGTNHQMDSGLMQITDSGPWPYVPLAEGTTGRPGDWVLALGHPGGYDAERGVVSRLGRIIRAGLLIQTDCTLLGGDSGGPLFDMRGQVIGIHSRISEATIENFHVPVRTFHDTWDRLRNGENWGQEDLRASSTIGVRGVDGPGGCRLERVNEDGPGAKAGLLPGDIVLRVQEHVVTDADSLGEYVRMAKPGTRLTLTLDRAGVELTVEVTVEARGGRSGRWRNRP